MHLRNSPKELQWPTNCNKSWERVKPLLHPISLSPHHDFSVHRIVSVLFFSNFFTCYVRTFTFPFVVAQWWIYVALRLHVTLLFSTISRYEWTSEWIACYNQSCVSVLVVDKISMVSISPLENFLIDRPFVYRIVKIDEKSTDITLFNGFVYNP